MPLFLYNIAVAGYGFLIRCLSPFNSKASRFINGRKGVQTLWKEHFAKDKRPVAWFHAASLGEFEQGKPVLEAFKKQHQEYQVFLTFFSPSGYELRKDYKGADLITYLPLDSKKHAQQLYALVNPSLIFFIKYEFWYHYLKQANLRSIPSYAISARFTSNHIFFKWYGSLHRRMLGFFDHIFVQDQQSLNLLSEIQLNNISISGDTRFDRVTHTLASPESYPVIEKFSQGKLVMVIGSSWPTDMQLLNQVINTAPEGIRFIIAPHEVHESSINTLQKGLTRKTVRITRNTEEEIYKAEVLIIDTIGMLSSVYQYGDFAYIGGAFGSGLHNILEAVTFGLPVIFGNKGLEKFPESLELIARKGAFSISSQGELNRIFSRLSSDPDFRQKASQICSEYIQESTGATEKIISYIKANYEG